MANEKTLEELRAEHFNALYSLNVNDKCEKKQNLTYLSWANAWAEFKKVHPSATYRIVKNAETSLPYFNDPTMGIMVFTEVTADELTYQMWLPVMDGANKAMKQEAYTYQVYDKYKNQYIEKRVEAATMFDINKAIMRCLVKTLAMFGEGLYIYAGEDLPEDTTMAEQQQITPFHQDEDSQAKPSVKGRKVAAQQTTQQTDKYAGIKNALNNVNGMSELLALYNQHKLEVEGNPEIMSLFSFRKNELKLLKTA